MEEALLVSSSTELITMSVVTPLLKSAEWAEQATQRGLLFSPLNTAFAAVPAMAPAIAYAIDQGETVAFVPATETNQQSLSEIQASAFASLRQRLSAVDWQHVDETDTLKNVLVFGGDFNAAECLLLPERLQEAHAIAQSPSLLACTPTRGVLLVWPYAKEDKPALEAFLDLCHQLYYDEDNESISPVIWGVVEGELKDAMKIDEAYLQYLRRRFSSQEPPASSTLATQIEQPAKQGPKRVHRPDGERQQGHQRRLIFKENKLPALIQKALAAINLKASTPELAVGRDNGQVGVL